MTDPIIALVPAPEHDYLTAAWMPQGYRGTVEKPARVIRCSCGTWACPVMADGHLLTHDDALVLYAPGGPGLGMVRLEAALGIIKRSKVKKTSRLSATYTTKVAPGAFMEWKWSAPVPPRLPDDALDAFFLMSLALERGIGAEVVVLP